MKRLVKLGAALFLALPLVAQAAMISFDELEAEMSSNKNLVIIGIDKAGGKLEGSSSLDYKLVRKDSNIPPQAEFEALMQEMGVNNNSKVVIVESGESVDTFARAARVYWSLKYYGFENVYILEGGLVEWEDMGGMLADEPAKIKKGNFKAKKINKSIYVSNEEMKQLVGKTTLIDKRPLTDYTGLTKHNLSKQYGHIDGAKTADLTMFIAVGSTLRSKAEIETIFKNMKIDLSKGSVVYCTSGHQGAAGWFIISEILGKKSRLYDGSMKEWDGAVTTKIQN